jgi:16S rRNA (guanine966-N2)-methyltransferase
MRVISGKFKSIEIPFMDENFENANATPQKIKKALFSILGEDLTGKTFLDLYAGSGQIGIEALSRNASMAVFNEVDHDRYQFIKAMIHKIKAENCSLVLNFHSFRCLRYLATKELFADYIFVDLPYSKQSRNTEDYHRVLDELNKYNVLKPGGKLIIQHLAKIEINYNDSSLKNAVMKKYAKNALTVFEK